MYEKTLPLFHVQTTFTKFKQVTFLFNFPVYWVIIVVFKIWTFGATRNEIFYLKIINVVSGDIDNNCRNKKSNLNNFSVTFIELKHEVCTLPTMYLIYS